MNAGQTLFAQVMDFLPLHQFRRCVQRYRGEHQVQSFSCLDRFLSMAFAQRTYRRSLRDVEACLRAAGAKVYPLGFRSPVARSTLADANDARDGRIYADLAMVLIGQARQLYAGEDLGLDLDATVYALDSTTIDLSLSLFPWARSPRTQGAVKRHTLLNLRGSIPEFIPISDGKLHDVNVLDILLAEPGSFYVMDRGYVDFARLYVLHQALAFLVTRAQRRFPFQRRYSRPVDGATGLRCDQTLVLTGVDTATSDPEPRRRIVHFDQEKGHRFVFLTNHFLLPATTVARLYQARWRVERFFKWIKQPLRIQAF